MMGLVAGCNTSPKAKPTPTVTYPPPLAASPTVNPVPPIQEGGDIHDPTVAAGISNPTQAALAAEGQQLEDASTLTPAPTAASLPMPITSSGGVVLQGTLYTPLVRPAPGILILSTERAEWEPLIPQLHSSGYAVMIVDMRGYGESGGTIAWDLATEDATAALTLMSDMGLSQTFILGASTGANVALNACAESSNCTGVVLLSPGLDYHGVTTTEAMARLGVRPILMVASENDTNNPADSITLDSLAQGDHRLVIYPAAGHGAAILTAEPGSVGTIVDWLLAHAPTLVPQPS
jgi:fermentation-respiration switch protein FrsA (DUF1100 family)